MRPETENENANRDIHAPDRRAVLAGIGVAAAAAAVSVAPTAADAQPAVATETFWNQRYEAMKGNVKLQLYRRRLKAPVAGERPLPVLILVHGSSMSAMPTFDLTVPGAGEYSMLNVFAKYGYDVWAIDFEGYGRSSVTPGWSDIKSGVADLAAMVPIVERETGQRGGYHMIGESSGALRVAVHTIARLGESAGGRSLGEHHFLAAGGQVKSMLSWLEYMKHGKASDRAFGLKMPPPNLQVGFEREAKAFVDGVADRALGASAGSAGA